MFWDRSDFGASCPSILAALRRAEGQGIAGSASPGRAVVARLPRLAGKVLRVEHSEVDAMIQGRRFPLGVVLIASALEIRCTVTLGIDFVIAESLARCGRRRPILCTITEFTGRSWMRFSIRSISVCFS